MPHRALQSVAALAAAGGGRQEGILEVLLQSVPAAIVVTDKEMRVLSASVKWLQAMGLDEAAVLGRSLYEIRPGYFPRFRESYERCLAGEAVVDHMFNSRPERPGGLWWHTEVTPWRDGEGAIGGTISVSIDITDMVGALARAERSEQRLRMAVELADVHVWEVDFRTGEMVTAGAAESFFDGSLDPQEIARDTNITIHPDDRARIAADWQTAMLNDEPFQPEYRINRQDGKEVWAACTTRLVRDEGGKPERLIGAMQNISARKAAETDLRRAKEEAEAANAAKSTFLATMSHEIRTPLNGVLGMAQAMASGDLPAQQRARLDTIRASGEALLEILNDILDLSKIEAGKLELEQEAFELEPLLETVRATFDGLASGKGLALDLSVEPAAQGAYLGDPGRLRQVLSNLVGNAVKFTEAGFVGVHARRDADRLVFEISDSGEGIPEDRLPHLFRKFEQADASTTRRHGGTGLGLAICRELCELMGGDISAESRAGAGSLFRVELPLPRAGASMAPLVTAKAPEPRTETPDRALRILAAEDNPVNQLVLSTLLEQIGLEVTLAGDGAEAAAAFEASSWDLVLMDVQMPTMDGLEATRRMRAIEAARGLPRTPILALTANAMTHQIGECLAAGMDAVVAKPIRAEDLFARVQQALDGASTAGAARSA